MHFFQEEKMQKKGTQPKYSTSATKSTAYANTNTAKLYVNNEEIAVHARGTMVSSS